MLKARDPNDRFTLAVDQMNQAALKTIGHRLEGAKAEGLFIRSEIWPYAEHWYNNGDLGFYKFWCQHPEVRKRPIEEKRKLEALADRIHRAAKRDDDEKDGGNANADHKLRDELGNLSRTLGEELRDLIKKSSYPKLDRWPSIATDIPHEEPTPELIREWKRDFDNVKNWFPGYKDLDG